MGANACYGGKVRWVLILVIGCIAGLLVLSIAAWQGYSYAAKQRALENARYAIEALKLTREALSFPTSADCNASYSTLITVFVNRLVDAKLAVTRVNDLLGGRDKRVEGLYAALTNQMVVVGHMRMECLERAAQSQRST